MEILGFTSDCSNNSILAKIGPLLSRPNNIILSDNTTIELGSYMSTVPAAFNLSNWSLVVEKWVPPTNLSNVDGVIKKNVTLTLPGQYIVPWSSFEGLANASGVGIYSNTFIWPPLSSDSNETTPGAYLKIPTPGVVQGISASINGRSLPRIDIFDPILDITTFLITGTNFIEIKVSTTLWNSLRPVWTHLKTGGNSPQITVESLLAVPQTAPLGKEQNFELAGVVQIIPYRTVRIT